MNNPETGRGKQSGRVPGIISRSRILSFLDRLCSSVHERLKTGFFARIFCSYPEKRIKRTSDDGKSLSFRRKIAGRIENSFFVNSVYRTVNFFITCRLKVYGAFLFAFAAVSGVYYLMAGFLSERGFIPPSSYSVFILTSAVLVSAILLISSRKTLFEAASESRIMKRILPVMGIEPEKTSYDGERGRSVVGLIFGIFAGSLSIFVKPVLIIGALLALIVVALVVSKPEFGVVCLIFIAPLLPTMPVAAFLILVVASYFIKIIRGKRQLAFETVDLFVLIFAALTMFGGLVSLSSESLSPSFLRLCLLFGFFIVASVKQTRDWLKRYAISVIASAVIVSLYGILMYFVGSKVGPTWLDASLFSDISGRAVSTLENPNMLGEYLILILPIAVSALITGEFFKRTQVFFFTLVMGFCLVLTWSRGAWLGFIFALVIMLLIWHKRSLWLVFGGIVAFPLATFVMPSSILNRFMSIGNLADTSTSYRVNIWRSAIRMVRDRMVTGIGIGEGAWKQIYPDYTLPGIEQAPHSHNLFMQISVEMGIIALIVFLTILFLSYQSGFTLFLRLSRSEKVDPSGLLSNDAAGVIPSSGRKSRSSSPSLKIRLAAAGPLCGIFGVLVQGTTDYSWYNYRVYLLFWLILGLAVAFVKNGREYVPADNDTGQIPTSEYSEIDIPG